MIKRRPNRVKIVAFAVAIVFSVLFSLIFKWIQTGNPFKEETIIYGVIIFLNVLILGYIGYVTLNKFSNKSTLETQKNIITAFLLFVFLALVISLSLVSIGVYS